MSYFIGYLIEGEAAQWHRLVAKDIAERFGTWKVYDKVAPHLTIFYPFDTEDIQSVIDFLAGWTKQRKNLGKMYITDFGHFDDTVVFAKVDTTEAIDSTVHALQGGLMQIAGTPRRGFRVWNPHATFAHRVPKETIRNIWSYIELLPKPNFSMDFDNLTLFKHEGERRWSVERIFRFS